MSIREAAAVLLAVVAGGCDERMVDQPAHRPLSASSFFEDGASAREPVPGTVPRGRAALDDVLERGKEADGFVDRFPFALDPAALRRGRERYAVFCTPCHGESGYGNGTVVRRGFRAPPPYHLDRLRAAPVGHLFDVVTNGFGAMPRHAELIPVRDRWLIVAYVRALQRSQQATRGDVPEAERRALEGGSP